MKLNTGKFFFASLVIAACSGCAYDVAGTTDLEASYADPASGPCRAGINERVYRNQFLRTRRIGEACAHEITAD